MKLAKLPSGEPEIFHTLQGEGRNVGRPSIFIRASLCNLHCYWCDTPYTWNWTDTNYGHEAEKKYLRENEIIDLSIANIAERVRAFDCANYVFTGGEPLLQEKAWTALMDEIRNDEPEATFEIETNGTLFPREDFLASISQLNVSPKLANSQVDAELRTKIPILEKLANTGKADFKFVIGSDDDFKEVAELIAAASLPTDRIFLMAQASSVAALEANQARVAELSLRHGMNYSDRLHLRLYGGGRGV